ncbi:MAG: hypothetical protein K2W96_28430 [Gemmataceae bacterium]|nr:hypothetical protein [Gemmataceae bacterium]
MLLREDSTKARLWRGLMMLAVLAACCWWAGWPYSPALSVVAALAALRHTRKGWFRWPIVASAGAVGGYCLCRRLARWAGAALAGLFTKR